MGRGTRPSRHTEDGTGRLTDFPTDAVAPDSTRPLVLAPMPREQESAWHVLFDIAEVLPTGWALVGGQMVFAHCSDRNILGARATIDADTVLDVRAMPSVLARFTHELDRLGFTPVQGSHQGHHSHWIRGETDRVDVLIPRHLGERAAQRRGVTGATALETPGAQHVLNRTFVRETVTAERRGCIPLPDFAGAMIAKAAALHVPLDRNGARHTRDFALLASGARPSDWTQSPNPLELRRLSSAIGHVRTDPRLSLDQEAMASMEALALMIDAE